MTKPHSLRHRLAQHDIVLAPGVYDALTASLAVEAGFEAIYLSGAAVSYTRLGRPDIGLTSVSEMTDTLALIRDRVDVPIIIDADNGFGNALNAQRTMRLYERAGANALQIEDQAYPKRCGHLQDKVLIPLDEMSGKIAACSDARQSYETLIIARTDAVAVEGFDAAMERGAAYLAAGADVLFVEAPQSLDQLHQIVGLFGDVAPLMVNMVEGGKTPMMDANALQEMGFDLVIFPGGIVRALARAAQDYYQSLYRHRSTAPFRDRMFDFDALNELIGTPETLEAGKRFATGPKAAQPAPKLGKSA